MIIYQQGDIFETETEALVNPVNCVGVMGGGLALEFKLRFPKMYQKYKNVCKKEDLLPGDIQVCRNTDTNSLPKYIVNFPTKDHWKNPSRIEYIQDGLIVLRNWIEESNIDSIAIPALGCGLGGLNWSEVKEELEINLKDLKCQIRIFESH